MLVTLVLVALISLLALGAGQTTRMQRRLATNEATRQIALQAAEAGLRAAESVISNASELAFFCHDGDARYAITSETELTKDEHWKDLETQGAETEFSLYDSATDGFIPHPRYLIGCIDSELIDGHQELGSVIKGQTEENPERRYFFRVFSIGFGPGGDAKQRLEARYVF